MMTLATLVLVLLLLCVTAPGIRHLCSLCPIPELSPVVLLPFLLLLLQ